MAPTTTPGGQPDEGLIEHLRGFAASCAAYIGARLQLAGLESKEASWHYIKLLILLFTGGLALIFGYIFLCIACVFLIHTCFGVSWMWTLLGVGILHLVITAIALCIVRIMLSKPMFTATIAEFKKDQTWLNSPRTTKKTR